MNPISKDSAWKAKEQAEEARYIQKKEQEQLAAIRNQLDAAKESGGKESNMNLDRNFEGGFGGQEDLEDRYATTSGEH